MSSFKSNENIVQLLLLNSYTQQSIEPTHDIMALIALRKLNLQSRMRSLQWGYTSDSVRPFVYFHTSCVRTAKALARLRGCAGSPEPSLVAYVISTMVSWAGQLRTLNWEALSGNIKKREGEMKMVLVKAGAYEHEHDDYIKRTIVTVKT